MSLISYRKKRDFRKTAEPQGKAQRGKRRGALFVVQKHDASHLHYDFRLETDGVLKSWAVPKGPTLDPAVKRLAVEVEDHPLEYGSFEGTIPAGEYGGGTVLRWDRGTWEAVGDAHEGLKAGRLKFRLFGEKLRGQWILVRSGSASAGKPHWLMFKLRDNEAKSENSTPVVDRLPDSVASGRNLEQISATTPAARKKPSGKKRVGPKSKAKQVERKRSRLPRHIVPQLPTLVEVCPEGDDWFHEVKFDGYRFLCWADGDDVRFETRNQLDWTIKLPDLAAAVGQLDLQQTVLDGELVAVDEQGVSDFEGLQRALKEKQRSDLIYTVFDLLFHEGVDLRPLPLEERKSRLEKLGFSMDSGTIRYTEHLVGNGRQVFAQARDAGLEGVVSKRRDQPYVSGRGTGWVKAKAHQSAEFVIGGFTEPAGSRQGLGALLVGYFEDKELRYAGKVGTGFDTATLRELRASLSKLPQRMSPFVPPPDEVAGTIHWVRPEVVANMHFSNWTRDKRLRHPVYEGLRMDKPARKVRRDVPKFVAAKRSSSQSRGSEATAIEGVRFTHPDKLLWPKDEISKRELAEYYVEIAPQMLPFLIDRPLSLVRCPDGIEGERFFQKHPGRVAPAELQRVKIREREGSEEYVVVKDVRGLIALAQIAAVELHVWGSRIDSLEKPDQMVLDLDPSPDVGWRTVVKGALEIRELLLELGMVSFVKTSGGKGLHLVLPLRRVHGWEEVREFSEQIAVSLVRAAPDRYTANMAKKARVGKIFIDYLRNQRGATSVAMFSTRARARAPISFPVEWRSLAGLTGPDQFHIRTPRKVLTRSFWGDYSSTDQRITKAMRKQLG